MNDVWTYRALGEIAARIESGGTPHRGVSAYWNGDIPWVTPGELTTFINKYISESRECITSRGLAHSAANILPIDALLVTTRASIGARALTGRPLATNQGFKSIVFTKEAHPDFYYHVLPTLGNELHRRASGTTFPEVSGREFARIVVPVPPLKVQRKIAEILDTVDELIRSTERLIAKQAELRQAIVRGLFARLIEQGCETRRLDELADVDRGKFSVRPRNDPRFYGGPYPFIQTGDVSAARGSVINYTYQSLNKSGRAVSREFPEGTIAVTIAANIADTAILGRPMCFPDSIVGVVIRHGCVTRYVELAIRLAKPRLEAQAPQSAQKNINLQDLRPLPIQVPSCEEQERIAQTYEALERRRLTSIVELAKLLKIRHGLVEDLLTGRVQVTVD